jgi:hypothetical protein
VSPATGPAAGLPRGIGRFLIAGRLGSGGQAEVFLSFHPELKVPVVVKWLRAQVQPDTASGEHPVREGQVLASLGPHPNLVRVYEVGLHEGRPFLVLEHVQGHTLDQYSRGERPSPPQAAELIAALAEAVHAAHEQKVIHQDVSPRNVLIDGRGQPRLIDFGLAWFRSPWAGPDTEARPDGGNPQFLSPEQADPAVGPIDRRSDVFGLGAVLYFLLTGRPLYNGATLPELLRQAAKADYDATALEKPGTPKRLAAVCRKALTLSPQGRFATAAELATALRAAVRRPRWRRVVTVAALFLAAVAGGWLLGRTGRHEPSSEVEASRLALDVQVWRPETKYSPLRAALPVRTGDELQVRFRVPAGLHVSLFSVNGRGRLSLLQQYPPQGTATTLVYPGANQTRSLEAPAGTEVLLVCGRREGAMSEAELQAVWDGTAPWPLLGPPRRLLRLGPDHVKEEGEQSRDFGATRNRLEPDPVVRQLDRFRDRLRPMCVFFEGLAFAHE